MPVKYRKRQALSWSHSRQRSFSVLCYLSHQLPLSTFRPWPINYHKKHQNHNQKWHETKLKTTLNEPNGEVREWQWSVTGSAKAVCAGTTWGRAWAEGASEGGGGVCRVQRSVVYAGDFASFSFLRGWANRMWPRQLVLLRGWGRMSAFNEWSGVSRVWHERIWTVKFRSRYFFFLMMLTTPLTARNDPPLTWQEED